MNKIKFKNYYKSTPVRMRKMGDAILLGCTSISTLVMGLPISDNAKVWATFAINIVGVAGKIMTNFFTDEVEVEPITPVETEPTEPSKPEANG